MAEILPFAHREPRRPRAGHECAGEIVIFPGIRIEYHDTTERPRKRQRRGKRNAAKGVLSA